MDTIAASGVRFEHAISPAPLTLPAHATLLTGLDPPQHGVRHNGVHRLDEGIPTLAERLQASGYATAAVVGALVLDRRFGLGRGFGSYDDHVGGERSGIVGYAERRADRVVDRALEWLADAPSRFFLWVHFYDPHTAYAPPRGFASAFASDPYAGEIAFADAQLGRLLDGLRGREAGGLLVAVASDHGESLGEHGELTHAYGVYDATQRVPLLLRGPGLPEGSTIREPVRLADLAPTILELCGAAPLGAVEGRSLLPLLAGGEGRGERLAYVETLATQLDFRWSPLLGIRSARWKYVRAPRPELYDLRLDPGERENRAAGEPEVVARLDALLEERLRGARPPRVDVVLDASDRELLQGLGYLVPAPEVPADLGRVGGPDPKDRMPTLRALAEAETLLGQGRPAEALARLDSVDESGLGISALRAVAALAAGEPLRAERAARAALADAPGRADLQVLLGRALEARGSWEGARAAFAAAAAADPSSQSAWAGLARALRGLGRPEEAAAAARRSESAGP
jgi:arylsulfatase A-like enzyme